MERDFLKMVLCVIIPLVMLCGLMDKKNRRLLFSLIGGCLACLFASVLNTWLYHQIGCTYFYLTTTVAPMVEEMMKFLPGFIFACLISSKKEDLIPIAFATGIGFSIIENGSMLMQTADSATIGWIIIRGIGTGLMHGMSATIIGIGVSKAFEDRRLNFTGTVAALFLAMIYHGAYNCMIQTAFACYLGVLLPFITYIVIFLFYKKEKIKEFLSSDSEEKG